MLETELDRAPTAPFRARRHVERFPCGLTDPRRTDAVLAASEVVANAYRHGHGRIILRLDARGHGLRAEVRDDGRGFDPDADAGLGLSIVGAVTDGWGVADGSTLVWFEIGTG